MRKGLPQPHQRSEGGQRSQKGCPGNHQWGNPWRERNTGRPSAWWQPAPAWCMHSPPCDKGENRTLMTGNSLKASCQDIFMMIQILYTGGWLKLCNISRHNIQQLLLKLLSIGFHYISHHLSLYITQYEQPLLKQGQSHFYSAIVKKNIVIPPLKTSIQQKHFFKRQIIRLKIHKLAFFIHCAHNLK